MPGPGRAPADPAIRRGQDGALVLRIEEPDRERPRYGYRRITALLEVRGVPEHIRPDDGPGSIAGAVEGRLARRGSASLYIEPGSPRESAYSEAFNSRLRDETLDRESFAAAYRRLTN